MKHQPPIYQKTFLALLFVCLLCISQISSTDLYQQNIIHAMDITNDAASENNTDTDISNNPNTPSDITFNENPYDNNTYNENMDNNDTDATPIPSATSSKTATNASITAAPAKKTPGKTIKNVYFSQNSIKLWPLHSTYNPITIKEKGAKYSSIKWSINNSSYAKISSNGTVMLKKSGAGKTVVVTAVVYYKKNGSTHTKSASYTIYGQQPVQRLKITNTKKFVFLGKRLMLKASCIPNTASCQKVSWSSSNDAYASISQKGIVHPKKAGTGKTVTFTAATTDGSKIIETVKVRIIDPTKPMAALTFNDGPAPAYTTKIVNALETFDAHATFFVLGSKLTGESAKSIIRKASKNGNEIASHTYNHKKLTSLSASDIQQEALRTENAIKQLIGKASSLTRPPYGSINHTVEKNINTPFILWSIDTQDQEVTDKSSIVTTVLNNIQDGDIILMHDIHASSADAAVELIPKLIQKGYQLVTVSELAAYKNAKLESGNLYYNIK